MPHRDRRIAVTARSAAHIGLVALAALLIVGCGATSLAADPTEVPVTVVDVQGSGLKELTLSQRAADRLGVETAAVTEEAIGGQARLVVPYAAILWDGAGDAWVYTATGPLTFIRGAIVVDRIVADRAILSDGPPVGTQVVTVGIAELHGVESGVGGGH